MKNIKYSTLLFILVSLLFGCSRDVSEVVKTDTTAVNGVATVKMYVPDYYELSNSERVIAPQTSYAKLSYFDEDIDGWTEVGKIALKDAERTEIDPSIADFPGYIYTFSFEKVYAQTYLEGYLRIELLDENENVITSGKNLQKVIITGEEHGNATFYTVPEDLYQYDSFLNKGQMKFYKYTFKADKKYFIHDTVSSENDYPDLVFFNSDGTLDKYFVVDSEEDSIIEIEPYSENTTKIIGIWSDDDSYISRYTINIYPELLGITLSETSIDLCKDETYQVEVKTIPEGAYLGDVVFTSDNELAVVSSSGVVSTTSTDDEAFSSTITASYNGFTTVMTVNFAKGTNIFGTLSGDDLHWTKQGSPYRVKGNLLVTEDSTLIVDAGVTVRFTGEYELKVRGEIQAKGTCEEPVIFTGKNGIENYQWNGINVDGSGLSTQNTYNYSSGNILEYCYFDYANSPLEVNSGAFVNYCKFDNGGRVNVRRASVLFNNEFTNGLNIELESDTSGYVIAENNIIKNYFRLYRWCYGAETSIKHNDFENCSFYLDTYLYNMPQEAISYNTFKESNINIRENSNHSKQPMTYNNFIDCDGYIVRTESGYCSESSYNFTNNYWGLENTEELNRTGNFENISFIYDYFDNSERSRVDYSNWLTEPVEKCGYLGDGFIAFDYTINGYDFRSGNLYPESKDTMLNLSIKPGYSKNEITEMRIAQNQQEIKNTDWENIISSKSFNADLSKLENGYAMICVQVRDCEGNESSVLIHGVPYDTPVISCSILDNKTYTDNDKYVTYNFSATDGGKIKKYQLYVDSALLQSGTDNWGPNLNINRQLGLKYMSAGSHTITLKVWDEAKNVGVKQVPFTISHSETIDTSTLAGTAWNTTTGQPLKDERTTYLWHLDTGGTEADNSSAGISDYTNAIGGFGGGCASYIYTDNSIPLDVSTNEFTVEYWIKNSNQNQRPYLNVNKGDSFSLGSYYEYFYYLDEDENVQNKFYHGTQRPESDTEWHYVAKVFNGSYFANYIDGVLTNYSENIDIELNNSDSKLYMRLEEADGIDEIRISNAARSADEISAYYSAAKNILDNSYGSLSGVIY